MVTTSMILVVSSFLTSSNEQNLHALKAILIMYAILRQHLAIGKLLPVIVPPVTGVTMRIEVSL